MSPTIDVKCISCTERSEADSLEAIRPGGDWRCPYCLGKVAEPAGDTMTGP